MEIGGYILSKNIKNVVQSVELRKELAKFIRHDAKGLYLINSPTGASKTYSILDLIVDYLLNEGMFEGCKEDKVEYKFVFVAPDKKKIDNPYDDLYEMLCKRLGNVDEAKIIFDGNVIKADTVVDKIKELLLLPKYNGYTHSVNTKFDARLDQCVGDFFTRNEFASSYKDLKRNVYYLKLLDRDKGAKLGTDIADYNNDIKKQLEENVAKSENAWRRLVKRSIADEAINNKIDKCAVIANNTSKYGFIKQLYPSSYILDMPVVFTNIHKFLLPNDLMGVSKSDNMNMYRQLLAWGRQSGHRLVLVIDEFDSVKKYMCDILLNDANRVTGDLFNIVALLVNHMQYNNLDGVMRQLIDRDSARYKEKKLASGSSYEELLKMGKMLIDEYWVDKKKRFISDNDKKHFGLLYSGAESVISDDGRFMGYYRTYDSNTLDKEGQPEKDRVLLQLARYNENGKLVEEDNKDRKSLDEVFSRVIAFCRNFSTFVHRLVFELAELEKEGKGFRDVKDYEVLDKEANFYRRNDIYSGFKCIESQEYIECCNKLDVLKALDGDHTLIPLYSYYLAGLSVIRLDNNNNDATQTCVTSLNAFLSPEAIICEICKTSLIIGISATVGIDSVISNFNLKWPELESHIIPVGEAVRQEISDYCEEACSVYQKAPALFDIVNDNQPSIDVEFLGNTFIYDDLKSVMNGCVEQEIESRLAECLSKFELSRYCLEANKSVYMARFAEVRPDIVKKFMKCVKECYKDENGNGYYAIDSMLGMLAYMFKGYSSPYGNAYYVFNTRLLKSEEKELVECFDLACLYIFGITDVYKKVRDKCEDCSWLVASSEDFKTAGGLNVEGKKKQKNVIDEFLHKISENVSKDIRRKFFIFTSYQTLSAGFNGKYEIKFDESRHLRLFNDYYKINKKDPRFRNKDFDGVYFGRISHVYEFISSDGKKNNNGESLDDKLTDIKICGQAFELFSNCEISESERNRIVVAALSKTDFASNGLHGIYKKCKSVKGAVSTVVCQAVGRILRTWTKSKHIYIGIYEDDKGCFTSKYSPLITDGCVYKTEELKCIDSAVYAKTGTVIAYNNKEEEWKMKAVYKANESSFVYFHSFNKAFNKEKRELMPIEAIIAKDAEVACKGIKTFICQHLWLEKEKVAELRKSACVLKDVLNPTSDSISLAPVIDNYVECYKNETGKVYKSYYFQERYVQGKKQYKCVLDQTVNSRKYREMSFKALGLDKLLLVDGFKDYLEAKGFCVNDWTDIDQDILIMSPEYFDICKGELGEQFVKFILQQWGIGKMKDMPEQCFELFDGMLNENICIDAKMWSQDNFTDKDKEKILDKADVVAIRTKNNIDKVIIINCLRMREDETGQAHCEAGDKIVMVPWLVDITDTGEVIKNMEAYKLLKKLSLECFDEK